MMVATGLYLDRSKCLHWSPRSHLLHQYKHNHNCHFHIRVLVIESNRINKDNRCYNVMKHFGILFGINPPAAFPKFSGFQNISLTERHVTAVDKPHSSYFKKCMQERKVGGKKEWFRVKRSPFCHIQTTHCDHTRFILMSKHVSPHAALGRETVFGLSPGSVGFLLTVLYTQ